MIDHPTQGAEESKPRFRPKGKMDELTRQKISELSEEYLRQRNDQMRAKNLTAQMALARERGELIEKRLIERQAAFVFVSFRQRMLNLSHGWARRFVGLTDMRQAKRLIDEMARSTLTELQQLPNCIESNWLERLEAEEQGQEGGKPPRPATGQEVKAEQAGLKKRREQKAAAMRKFRARK